MRSVIIAGYPMNASRSTSPSRTRPAAEQTLAPEPTVARTALVITSAQRRALRADAHHLDPVVMIGDSGLTEAVVAEADRALNSHELIKIRVLGDDREVRALIMKELCSALGCAPVQMIGKLLVIWRPAPPAPKDEVFVPKKEAARRAAAPAKQAGSKTPRRSSAAVAPSRPAKPAVARTANAAGAKRGATGGTKTSRASASKPGAKSFRGDRPTDRTRSTDGTGFGGGRSSTSRGAGRAPGVRTSGPRADRTELGPAPRPTSRSRPTRPAASKAPSRRAPPRKR